MKAFLSASSRSAARTTKVLAGRGEFCTPSQYSNSSPVAIHSARSPSQASAASPWPPASAVPQVGQPAST